VEALMTVARQLPRDLQAPVCIVLHLPSNAVSVLPRLLTRAGKVPASYAEDGETIQLGRIYIAPPDHHLLVEGGRFRLGRGARENGSRPAIDPLFRSIAQEHGPGAIGVVLSGALYDGTAGLKAIKAAGGIAIVQDPEEATYPSMPRSALQHVAVDHVVAIDKCAGVVERLVREAAVAARPAPIDAQPSLAQSEALEMEVSVARSNTPESESGTISAMLGEPSGFACPDCHGVLWEIKDDELIRFRCRVGHAYVPDGLVEAQSEKLEEALWIALRSLRESAALATRLATRARDRNWTLIAESHDERAREAAERARAIEQVLERGKLGAIAPDPK
jgi:two-component system chemotaxis response regulator CheB